MGKKLLRASLILLLIFSLSNVEANLIRSSRAQVNHDIAVINVKPSRTLVTSGELVNITVIVENQGSESETFNVTLYRDTIPIETNLTVSDLTAGQNTTLVFTWNTIDTIKEIYPEPSKQKSYDIRAVASLPSDADQLDNTFTSLNKIKVISQYIAVRPERTVDETLTKDKNYTVSVYTDYNGTDIWGYNVQLTFSPAVLECIEVRNGDLITTAKNPSARFLSNINNAIGEVSAGAFFYYLPPDQPATTFGPGALVNVTFKIVGTGTSNITLGKEGTYLQGYNAETDQIDFIINELRPSLRHVLSGYFSNTVTQNIDIAIISVTPFPTSVTQGETVNITVVIDNRGASEQTFDVKAYYDYNAAFPGLNVIGTKTMQSLAAGARKTFTFIWNTTYVKEGNYTITAMVVGVQGDVDTTNNQLNSDERVAVRLEELRPLPITELIVGVVAIIAVVAVIYFVLRRRRKKPPLE